MWCMCSGWPGACKDVSGCLGSGYRKPGCWLHMESFYRVTKLTVRHGIGSWPFFQPQVLVGALVTSAGLLHSLHGLSFDLSSLLKNMHISISRMFLGLYLCMSACPYGQFCPLAGTWSLKCILLCKQFLVLSLIKLTVLCFVMAHDTRLNLFGLL